MPDPHHPGVAAVLAIVAATALAGCGITDPYAAGRPRAASTHTAPTPATIAQTSTDPAPERGGTIPATARSNQQQLAPGAGAPTAQGALERYARLYVNWTAKTVAAIQRRLAAISLGQARAQALQAAASYDRDQTLAHSDVSNHGRLVAITPSLTGNGEWVLVTSEQTTGQGDYAGLPATLHVTYARATQTPSGWVVTEWDPRS